MPGLFGRALVRAKGCVRPMLTMRQSLYDDVSIVAAVLAGIFVLAAEVALAVLPLVSLFERTEPSAVN